MLRVVLDTSVLVSNVLFPKGVPAQVFKAWRAQSYSLFTTQAIIAELVKTLGSPRIRKRYDIPQAEIEDTLRLLWKYALFLPGTADVSDAPLRDPNDLIILSAVAEAEAHVLVASDKDLLVLREFRGTRIVTPRWFFDFLARTG